MFIGAGLGPQLTGALSGLGFGGVLRVIVVALTLGVLLALSALRHRGTEQPPPRLRTKSHCAHPPLIVR
ncbi:hypothetical protein BX257_0043 [Streptomyces sp. 3212.3]|uniref:hypothetical protein n=1 Tax=unclassified Streptomyces TaxID=2593676 RepID=UPI000740D9AA|nr:MULTISPECIES: hypothetical protein [unclassified Streptomyces]KUJ33963.1 hypothetical protein ADL25_43075 [Streptomyces sp. NRRL F-5122]REE57680.1 hypothetical protein BX257_0043 [Streptomyces sp. 3212.3]